MTNNVVVVDVVVLSKNKIREKIRRIVTTRKREVKEMTTFRDLIHYRICCKNLQPVLLATTTKLFSNLWWLYVWFLIFCYCCFCVFLNSININACTFLYWKAFSFCSRRFFRCFKYYNFIVSFCVNIFFCYFVIICKHDE